MSWYSPIARLAVSVVRRVPLFRRAAVFLALDPALLRGLVEHERFRRHAASDKQIARLLALVLKDSEQLQEYLANETGVAAQMARFLTVPEVLAEVIGRSPGLKAAMWEVLTRSLTDPEVLADVSDESIGLESAMWKVLTREASLDRAFADKTRAAMIMDAMRDRMRAEFQRPEQFRQLLTPNLIKEAMMQPEAVEAMLPSAVYAALVKAWISRPGFKPAFELFYRDEEALSQIEERPGLVVRILQRPKVYSYILGADSVFNREVVPAHSEFNRLLRRLLPHLRYVPGFEDRLSGARQELRNNKQLRTALYRVACPEDLLELLPHGVELPDDRSYYVQLHEIFESEDYYFETDTESPLILDCGTHMGLGIYYFKVLYPGARVVGFEPTPELHAVACRNMERCGFADVTIHPYALSDADGETTFHVRPGDTMAGTITDRRSVEDADMDAITVPVRRLSPYIDQPVHYLKLDIEGSEDAVLEECRSVLYRVQHIFCEYHHGGGLATDRLARILQLLDDAGFDTQIGKSWSFQRLTDQRPMSSIDRPYSAVIWARNRVWPPVEP